MTTQQVTFQLPPYGTASLTLSETLTPEAYARLDAAIDDALGDPHPHGYANANAAIHPGAVEFASWLIHLQ